MNDIAAQISVLPGRLRWLVRSTEGMSDARECGGKFYAHIYGKPMFGNSYEAGGDTPEEALTKALERARSKAAA
jgi:hypothetical protein